MTNEIISFDILKINRGKQKICRCEVPNYEIDITNRLVMCTKCGAIVNPFDALVILSESYEQLEEKQKRMLQKYETYKQLAEEEYNKMIKNKVFRDMNNHYKNGMFPLCPNCNQAFDPITIKNWCHVKLTEFIRDKKSEE